MRIILSLTTALVLLTGTGAFAQSGNITTNPGYAAGYYGFSAEANDARAFYRQEGGPHATTREQDQTSSWEGSGPFAGNPNGN